ncbi:hypothetical protein myaer87_04640 [Microcystis aeruginosa NIES-87]|uniref:hypothetical protein n=1 Tax=Microcystis aeruginosa TaxID=1126 RepID=UPI000CB8A5AF|nr:hypothetical protein [Microcystis aeruginosa]WNF13089.1 hypothetical protein RKE53_13185 [Microcystis aeruginosa NRERC-214]GBE73237.1 hypothetical protein myaer87_04640 [Microcystis aeruginosa NIES-87]
MNDVNITKEQGFGEFKLAGKWKKTYGDFKTKEPWYILTDRGTSELENLPTKASGFSR